MAEHGSAGESGLDRSVIDLLPYAVLVLDEAGTIRHWNPIAGALLDSARAGTSVFEALPFLRDTPLDNYLQAGALPARPIRFSTSRSTSVGDAMVEVSALPSAESILLEIRELPGQ